MIPVRIDQLSNYFQLKEIETKTYKNIQRIQDKKTPKNSKINEEEKT